MSVADADPYLRLVERDLIALELLARCAERAEPKRDVSDWKTTFIFYMACVYMKALGRCRGIDFQDHFGIKQWMNTTPDLVGVAKSYRKLEERSRDARYEGKLFRREELQQTTRWFLDVRDRVEDLLKQAGIASPPRVDPSKWI